MSVGGTLVVMRAFAPVLLAAVIAQAAANPAARKNPPLGLDLYMPVPEENPL